MRGINILGVIAAAALLSACQRNDSGSAGAGADNQNQSSGRAVSSDTTNISGRAASSDATNAQYDANNSGRNERDRSGNTLTPGDQGGSQADRDITQKVRRAITSNDQLSTDAKNVKVITINGKVTLRGPVNSAQEQQTLATL